MSKVDLPPSAVVLDLVLTWTPVLTGKAATAAILPSSGDDLAVMVFARNHRDEFVQLQVPANLSGETRDGSDGKTPRWILFRIAPGVWKLSQSILNQRLHAYVTIVGVPEPAPWALVDDASPPPAPEPGKEPWDHGVWLLDDGPRWFEHHKGGPRAFTKTEAEAWAHTLNRSSSRTLAEARPLPSPPGKDGCSSG